MLSNEDIKFFNRQDIKDAIALEKLDYVYEEYSSAHRLTEILKGLGIDALNYLTILPEVCSLPTNIPSNPSLLSFTFIIVLSSPI